MTTPLIPRNAIKPDAAASGVSVDDTIRDLFGPEAQGVQGGVSVANQIAAPNRPEDEDTVEPLDRQRALMAALYGSDFPLINALDIVRGENPIWDALGKIPPLDQLLAKTQSGEWVSWVRGRWSLHGPAVQMHLYLIARNRLFRAGQQWVSSSGREPWRAPARPTESARVVHNLIAPALDQRQQVISDQRPGFDVDPESLSPEAKRKAEGRQQALEHQYEQQNMRSVSRDAAYWAGTDGVAFWHTFWDRDAGKWDARMDTPPGQGYELDENGVWINAETGDQKPAAKKPMGDLATEVLRVEQVRVSANATATKAPYYAILREVLSETDAAYLYGAAGVQDKAQDSDVDQNSNTSSGTGATDMMPSWVLTQTVVGEGNRLNNIKTVERYIMYVDRHPDVLPDGLQLVVVGNAVVWGPGELLFGVIPVTAVRDGSTDPSYYPRPIMEQWIPPQMRVNAALSLWVNNARVNAGGQMAARPDAFSRETFVGSGKSVLEIEGNGPIGNDIMPIQGFQLGQDVKDLIAFDVKAIEDMTGYNDVSRGQVSGETATAVATANEQLQRVFAPPVEAMASAFEGWARINLAGMAWGYDIPRDVGAVGTDRPDLARALSAEDFEGPASVRVDPARMMPVPKFVRQAQLDDLLAKQVITPQQYLRNHTFATVNNLTSPDEDQESRAKRVADALRLGQQLPAAPQPGDPAAQAMPLAIRWTDNEAIHQDVLEREILTQDDLPPATISAAYQRWMALADQARMKQGTPPTGGGPGSPDTAPPPGGVGVSEGEPSPFTPPTPGGPSPMMASPDQVEPLAPSESAVPPIAAQ